MLTKPRKLWNDFVTLQSGTQSDWPVYPTKSFVTFCHFGVPYISAGYQSLVCGVSHERPLGSRGTSGLVCFHLVGARCVGCGRRRYLDLPERSDLDSPAALLLER